MKTKISSLILAMAMATGSGVRAEQPKTSSQTSSGQTQKLKIKPVIQAPTLTDPLPSAIPKTSTPAQPAGSKSSSTPRVNESAVKISTRPRVVIPALQNIPRNVQPPSGSVAVPNVNSGSGAAPGTIPNQVNVPGVKGSGAAANGNIPQGAQGPPKVTPGGIDESGVAPFEGRDVARRMSGVNLRGDAVRTESPGLGGNEKPGNTTRAGNGPLNAPPLGSEIAGQVEQLSGLTGKSNTERMSDTSQAFRNSISTDPATQLSNARDGRASSETSSTTTNADGTTTENYKVHDTGGNLVEQTRTTYDSGGNMVRFEQRTRGENGSTVDFTSSRNQDGSWTNSMNTLNPGGTTTVGPIWTSPGSPPGRSTASSVDPDSPHGAGSGWIPLHKKPDPMIVTGANAGTPGGRPADAESPAGAPRLNLDVDLTGQPNPDEGRGQGGENFMNRRPPVLDRPPNPNDPGR